MSANNNANSGKQILFCAQCNVCMYVYKQVGLVVTAIEQQWLQERLPVASNIDINNKFNNNKKTYIYICTYVHTCM